MGAFYKMHSLALSEDLPLAKEGYLNSDAFYGAANAGYDKVSPVLVLKLKQSKKNFKRILLV